jgi:hypothetical protein
MENLLTKEERYSFLLKPNWSAKDIAAYGGFKESKSYEIRKVALEKFDGSVKYMPERVKVDSALQAMGTNLKDQIEIIKAINIDKKPV